MVSDDFFLFVSHVSEDQAAALQIVHELEARGVRCWIAPRNVRPGSPFDDEIADAIGACRAMLLIFSNRCNESEYIRREITVAGNASKIIIPFRIENAEPKRGLSVRLANLHWIDAFVSREKAIDEVVRSVQGDRPSPPPAPSPPAQKDDVKPAAAIEKEQKSTFDLILFPWTKIATRRQARTMMLVGAICFALIGLGALAWSAVIMLESSDWGKPTIALLIAGTAYAGCAIGTYFGSRAASVTGFAPLGLCAAVSPIAPGLVLLLPFALAAFAGVRGAFAESRLRPAADEAVGRSL